LPKDSEVGEEKEGEEPEARETIKRGLIFQDNIGPLNASRMYLKECFRHGYLNVNALLDWVDSVNHALPKGTGKVMDQLEWKSAEKIYGPLPESRSRILRMKPSQFMAYMNAVQEVEERLGLSNLTAPEESMSEDGHVMTTAGEFDDV
jgi:hypothetical protein